MDRASDHSVVKILISAVEYKRLLHIEKKYLELEHKYNSQQVKGFDHVEEQKPLPKQDEKIGLQNQIGSGQSFNHLGNFAKLVAQFMLKENSELQTPKPDTAEFAQSVKHSLQNLFGQINLGKKNLELIVLIFLRLIFNKLF